MKRFLPLALIVATFVVTGCSSDENPDGPAATGDLAGKVLNQLDNTPIAGATLKIQGSTESTTSDSSGSFSLKNIKPGSYHLIASKEDFTTQSDDITITAGTTLSHDIHISWLNGLTAFYKLAGNAVDAVTGGSGTLQGVTGTADRFGVANGALSFDGASSATIPSSPTVNLGGTSSFTVSFWAKLMPLEQTEHACIISKGEENGSGELSSGGYHLIINDGGTQERFMLVFGFKEPAEPYVVSGTLSGAVRTSSFADGNWHMLTYAFDRQQRFLRIFRDSMPYTQSFFTTEQAAYDLSSNAPLYLGRNFAGTKFFKGGLDDLRIYNRVLSDEEVEMLYHEGGYK